MKTILTTTLMLAAALVAAPNASADFCGGDPSAVAETCWDDGTVSGYMHSKQVTTSGCLIDLNGKCVPRTASVRDGNVIGAYDLISLYVGVDVNALCNITPGPDTAASSIVIPHGLTIGGCGASYDSAPPTAYAMGVLF